MGTTARLMKMDASTTNGPILFFDGECGLCGGTVSRLAKWDRRGLIRYAPLQGTTAKKLLPSERVGKVDTVILWSAGKIWDRSDAVLKVMELVGGIPWWVSRLMRFCPRFVRNRVYRMVAANRHPKGQCDVGIAGVRCLP